MLYTEKSELRSVHVEVPDHDPICVESEGQTRPEQEPF